MTATAQPQTTDALLARECEVFCRYLIGRAPSSYVAQKYAAAHAHDARYSAGSTFDRALLVLARLSPLSAQFVDAYASLAARSSLLRKKLVLLVAILESCDPSHGFDDRVNDTASGVVILRMAWRGSLFALRLLLAALILVPVHFICGVGGALGARR